MTNNKKIRVHIKNNHWAPGSFPNTPEGEKVFTITKNHVDKALEKFPKIKDKVEIFIDWDVVNFEKSMPKTDILISYDFPKNKIKKISPNLKWIHCVAAGIEHLLPLDWMPEGLVLTNNGGVHSKKAGEFGLMSVLMLHNHLPKIISNQIDKKFESLFSNPITGKTIVVVGTGNLGAAMIRLLAPLGPNIIGVNRKGGPVEGCSKVVSVNKIDSVLPKADILYLATPETPETINLINHQRLNLLKSSCGIINIGRESVMDYKALFARLENKEIAGAILDVFTQEPIESSSKIWNIPNLLITPHVSADDGESYVRLTLELFVKNLKLFIENKPLVNQIDKKLGY